MDEVNQQGQQDYFAFLDYSYQAITTCYLPPVDPNNPAPTPGRYTFSDQEPVKG